MITRRTIHALVGAWMIAAPAAALDIATPVSGAIVRSGTSVTVRVTPAAGEQITDVTFVTREGGTTAAPGVLQADVPIPIASVGPEFIVAWARLADGGVSVAFVQVVADPGGLQQIKVEVLPLLDTIGEVARLQVTGIFLDGVSRDLSGADRGTTYESTNASVLAVHPSGIVQARGRGTAQVIVTSRGRSAVATIVVQVPSPPDNRIPVPDAGPDQVVAPEALVTLDGSASADPDGDPLTLRWEQTDGPGILLRDPATTAPYFAAPRVGEETVLEFALVVSDNKGATSFPSVVHITVRP
jgi:hypothetical protein